MALGISGSKSKNKSSATQKFNQTADARLSDRSYNMLTGRAEELGNRQYQNLDPNSYKAYMNPYQQEVIDATMADLGAQRDLAANAQRADLAGAGAFGDDRRGVMEAELAGQADRTAATTLAALRSRGFEGAQGVAAGENTNRNQYDQNTQAMLNQLYALLGGETTTRTSGTSLTNSKGSGSTMGFTGSYGG